MHGLSIKVPIRKKSGNLFNDPHIIMKMKVIPIVIGAHRTVQNI